MVKALVIDEENAETDYFLKAIKKRLNDKSLLEEQRDVFNDFYKHLRVMESNQPLKEATILNNFNILHDFALFVRKPFNEVTEDDLKEYFLKMVEEGKKHNTIALKKMVIKRFFKFLNGSETYPAIVKGIKATTKPKKRNEDELLTPEDIKKMVNVCVNPRDRCIVMVLYESACRIGEITKIRLRNIVFDDYGVKIGVDGKTGKRSIRLIQSVPYIQEWLNNHPYKDDPDAYLFVSLSNRNFMQMLRYQTFRNVVVNSAERAGIKKTITPHLFRHSMLNELGKQGFTERDLKIFAGWKMNSEMPSVYLHYGDSFVDDKILVLNGIKKEEEKHKNEALKPKACPRCKQSNPATALYCNCGMALDLKTVLEDEKQRNEADGLMNELFKDDEFKQIIKHFLNKKLGSLS